MSGIAGQFNVVDLFVEGQIFLGQKPAVVSAAGAVSPDVTLVDVQTAGAIANTLANPTGNKPSLLIAYMSVDGGTSTWTPANLLGYSTIAFNDVGDAVVLFFNGSKWVVLSNQGCTLA